MKNLKTYCLAVDLVSDPNLIDEYKKHHQNVWPEIIESIKSSSIEQMEIYQLENRLFMIIKAYKDFDISKKVKNDKKNPAVQKWEELMWKYQQVIPGGKPGEKWRLMDKIFDLKEA